MPGALWGKLVGRALRQRTGAFESLLRLVGPDGTVRDFCMLSRRQKTLAVNIPSRRSKGPRRLLSDDTGLKIAGESEWNSALGRVGIERVA